LKTLNIFFILLSLSIQSSEKIVIDVNKSDNLNLSTIAGNIVIVPLKKDNIISVGIQKIFLMDRNVYVFQRYKEKESEIMHSNVYIFDLSGNYKAELVAKDPNSKKPPDITDMLCDESNNRVFLSYDDGYRVFDNNGNFLFFKKNVQLKFPFKNLFWSVEHSNKGDIGYYNLVTTDLNGLKKDTVKTVKTKLTSSVVRAFTMPSFSIHEGELYISFGFDNTIYHIKQKTLTPAYSFEFKNRPVSQYDVFGAPSQLVFSRFVKYGIKINGVQGDVLFDTRDNKSLFIKYSGAQNELDSGVHDDIYNTGYFKLNLTNKEDYIYFFREKDQIKTGELNKLYDSKTSLMVFLVKLK